jgi:hypothetical protein
MIQKTELGNSKTVNGANNFSQLHRVKPSKWSINIDIWISIYLGVGKGSLNNIYTYNTRNRITNGCRKKNGQTRNTTSQCLRPSFLNSYLMNLFFFYFFNLETNSQAPQDLNLWPYPPSMLMVSRDAIWPNGILSTKSWRKIKQIRDAISLEAKAFCVRHWNQDRLST